MSGRIWDSGQLSTSPHYLRTKLQDLEVLQHFSIYTLLLKIPVAVVSNNKYITATIIRIPFKISICLTSYIDIA